MRKSAGAEAGDDSPAREREQTGLGGLTPNESLDPEGAELRGRLAWLGRATARLQLAGTDWLPSRRRFEREGTLFREHRAYTPGDALRSVDWHVFARRRELVTKVYDPDERAHYAFLLDLSGSILAGGPAVAATTSLLALATAYVALVRGNQITLGGLGPHGRAQVQRYEHFSQSARLIRDVARFPRGAGGEWTPALARFAAGGRSPGGFVVASDFHPTSRLESFLRALRGARVLLLHPVSAADLQPLRPGLRRIIDAESKRRRWLLVNRSVARRYRSLVLAHRREVRSIASQYGAAYFEVDVAEPFDHAVATILHRLVTGGRRR